MTAYGISQQGDLVGRRVKHVKILGIGIDQFDTELRTSLVYPGIERIYIYLGVKFIGRNMMKFHYLMRQAIGMRPAAYSHFDGFPAQRTDGFRYQID